MGTVLTFVSPGRLTSHRGTVACTPAHVSLPCPRTESSAARDHGRHYGLNLLTAYALVPGKQWHRFDRL